MAWIDDKIGNWIWDLSFIIDSKELTSMYLSSGETFMISLVITLIAGLIYVLLRGQDDDHDQGAGAVGACPFSF